MASLGSGVNLGSLQNGVAFSIDRQDSLCCMAKQLVYSRVEVGRMFSSLHQLFGIDND